MKITFLNQAFVPDVVASGQYIADLTSALIEKNHDVTIIASQRAYDEPSKKFPKITRSGRVTVRRVGGTGFGKGARWKRGVDFASVLLATGVEVLLHGGDPDVVISLTSPPNIWFLGALFAKFRRRKFIYWVLDMNPDAAVEAKWLRRGSLAHRLLEWMSRYSLRAADRIVVLDKYMAERVLSKGISPEKIVVVPPWPYEDKVVFSRAGRQAFRARHALEGKFVVMYSGNHSPCHPLDTVLEVARNLNANARYVFCFIGGGSEKQKVEKFRDIHGLRNIVSLPYEPLSGLSASLSAADLHLVVLGNPFVGTIHPCKIYSILTLGIPFAYIGPKPSHISDILSALGETPYSIQADHGEVWKLESHIKFLAKQEVSLPIPEIECIGATFSRERLMEAMLATINAVSR